LVVLKKSVLKLLIGYLSVDIFRVPLESNT
jgi:hypothetical protein